MYSSKLKILLSISFVVIITVILHYLGWIKPIENSLRRLIIPGSQLMYSLSVNIQDKTEEFSSVSELKQAYKKLKEETIKIKINQTNYQLLKEENEELRKQLQFFSIHNYQQIGGEVIGKNIDPLGSTLILNRGTKDGVQKNQPVIINNGVLIGKIARVEEKLSIIQLINDNQSKIAATVINQDKSIGLVEGGYGISVRMNFIPQNETVNIGDTIITSGLEKDIPRGLLIGIVEAVEKEAYHPFQRAILTPAADLNKITLVSVINFPE